MLQVGDHGLITPLLLCLQHPALFDRALWPLHMECCDSLHSHYNIVIYYITTSGLRYCSDVCSGVTVIQAMKFQVAEMTIYPLSFNKTNCDHLI